MFGSVVRKRHRTPLLLACGILLLAACSQREGTDSQDEAAGTEEVLKIGVVLSLSGEFFEPAGLVQEGYEFWAETVNSNGGIEVDNTRYTVELVIQDDRSDATTTALATQRVIAEDEVDFVFGPYSSGLTIAAGGIVERNNVVMMAPGGNADTTFEQGYEYMFTIVPRASTIPGQWLDVVLSQTPEPTTLAIVAKNDPFALSQRTGLKESASATGVSVVEDVVYSPDQQDFSTVVSQLRSQNPDILAVLGHLEDSTVILRQMEEQGYYPPGGAFFSGPPMGQFYDLLKSTANYSYGGTFWEPEMGWEGDGPWRTADEYATAFRTAYDRQPVHLNATASAAGVLLTQAIQEAGTIDADAVREALLSSTFATFQGPVEYSETGENEAAQLGIQQIIDGQVFIVAPEEHSQREPVYPVPGWTER